MAPKKKPPKKPEVDKEVASIPPVTAGDALLDVQHLNHLYSLYDSGSNSFHCTATELEAPAHGASLLEGMNQIRQKQFLCDLTIATKTKSFEVHKLILASCSEYFQCLLQTAPQLRRVELHGMSPLGLATTITYACTGRLSLSLYTIGSTIAAATRLRVPALLRMCSNFLLREMAVENCAYIANVSGTLGLSQVKDAMRAFIREHFLEFSRMEQFTKLPFEQLNELLMDDGLQVPSEVAAFQIAVKWLEFDPKRVRYAADLLSNRPGQPCAACATHDARSTVPQDPQCHKLLVDAMNYHLLPHQQNCLQSRRTRIWGGQRELVTVGGCPALAEKALSREISYRDAEGNWHPLMEMPAKSFNQCVVVMDGFIYIVGGEDQNDARNQAKRAVSSLSRYDPHFNTWLHLASMQHRRSRFGLSACHELLYAVGGCNAEGPLASMECYVPTTNSWQSKASLETPRCCHATTILNGKLLVTGGSISRAYSRTVLCYHPSTDSWREQAMLSTPRGWHCAATVADRAYVLGRRQVGPQGERVDVVPVECYSPVTGQWSYLAPLPTGVSMARVALLEGCLCFMGGWNESGKRYQKCVQCYNPDLNEWAEDKDLPEATVGVSCCTITLPRPLSSRSQASSVGSAAAST